MTLIERIKRKTSARRTGQAVKRVQCVVKPRKDGKPLIRQPWRVY